MALRALNLMIGDWVKVTDDDTDDSFIGQVKAIDELENINVQEGEDVAYPYSIDCLEPIPLTPEILEKNGFVKQGFDGWEIDHKNDDGIMDWMTLWRNDYIRPHLLIKSFVSLLGSFSSFGINYVHQLQHALRLCGIEKEIEL